ncbi:DUF4340 domain-containing protein [Desulfopila aestuarii]|uniref:DUF4340 domain-containing protein n=1 Tax=Desulfopila aestuarii DSM 18488 TaxID=1121416 RepID=A0A1M7XWL5_9BACT|nr:DUF4340 domain-containing protein [Desulfopila aestuarii]SHO43131.1 protein of unknown function [Desulfopila aestuarii DSM 18488]
MKKITIAAAILLLVQLGLVAFSQITNRKDMSTSPETPFLAVKGEEVTGLTIIGDKDEKVILEKRNGAWILPETFDLPADQKQATTLIDKLVALKQGFVVASSREAAKRFQVSEDSFVRHLVVHRNDTVAGDLFIGTSPAFRQVHARNAGSDDIVAVNLSTYELETDSDKWLDKTLLQVSDKDLAGIEYADFSLIRKKVEKKDSPSTWRLAEKDGENLDVTVAGELANAITGLTITSVIDPQESSKIAIEKPELKFTVHTVNDTNLEYAFAQKDDNTFAVKRSDKELLFVVSKASVEQLKKYNRDALLVIQPEAEPEPTAAAATETSAAEAVPAQSALPAVPPVPADPAGN